FGEQYQRYTQYSARHQFLLQSSRNVIELLVIGVLLFAIMLLVGTGSPMHTIVPTLAFFAVAAFRLMPSSQRLLANAHLIQFGARSLRLLRPDLIVSRDRSLATNPTTEHFPFQHSLELRGVTFRYPSGDQEVLRDATILIQRGAMVGFQGKSGAGKTTLVDLILGLLMPTTGEVLVDGNSIHDNLPGWLGNIGYVPQSIFLMDDTLRRNVAFGVPDSEIDDARVQEVLSLAQLDGFLDSKRGGLDTLIGERGVRLSGGQRQRIGIARALYHDPEMLILDEATASLDLETEAEFIETLKFIKNLKTLIVISHRRSTIAECGSTYQLTQGKLNRADT
ncbi:MAG: ABC transporter ATP-binding protein, partial [Verrucomicrobiota bacterium]|nr:ABC transporter ATP-binding protein [Verrucomicrobiota bacterium]